MKYLFVLPVVFLTGCWFVYIPAGFFTKPEGGTCIQRGFFTGDKIKHLETGKIGTITAVYGPSSRCRVESHPILADVEFG